MHPKKGDGRRTCPYPTSTPTTCAAPRCSRQSAKPPVDRPESSILRPLTSTLKWSRAASSLSPALHGTQALIHTVFLIIELMLREAAYEKP